MIRLTSALIILLLCLSLFVACAKKDVTANGANKAADTAVGTAAETEGGTWEIATLAECPYHHRDYHVIPYNLVKHVGVDECNEWAKEAKKTMGDGTDPTVCTAPDFTLKKFIDHFNISREDFVTYGDLVYYGTYNTERIYTMSNDELSEYYVYSDALIDETIKSQHLQFIEKHFKYEYSSDVYKMTVYDNETGTGMLASIPTMVQELNIDRGTFEKILQECTDTNVNVYGRSFNFEYDLDTIYNEDGSFNTLPEFDGMSDYLREMKLNRMFCGVDE